MLWAQYSTITRELLGVSYSDETFVALPNTAIASYVEWSDVPPAPWSWNKELLNWSLPTHALLTQQEFMDRWEYAGLGAVLDLLFTLEVDTGAGGAAARKWLTRFRTARGIDPTDPRTIDGTDQLIAMGVAAGAVTSQQATDGRPVVLGDL
jgi:hypothetical protein